MSKEKEQKDFGYLTQVYCGKCLRPMNFLDKVLTCGNSRCEDYGKEFEPPKIVLREKR